MDINDIYAAGGSLYYDESGVWVKFGGVQDFRLKNDTQTEEIMDFEGSIPQVADEIIMKSDVSVSFKTKQVNAQTLQMMFLTSLQTNQDNPAVDGIEGATKVSIMKIGKGSQWIGKMKFVSNPRRGKKIVVILNKSSLKPSGEIPLIGSQSAELDFTAKAGKDDTGEVGTILREES